MSACRPGRWSLWRSLLAILSLLLLCLVDFGQMLLPGPWVRQYVAAGDFSRQFYPFQHYAAERLAQWQLPLWDPYILGGQPHLADPQTAVFYPVGLLVNLVAGRQGLPYVAMEWRAFLDVALGTIFTYLFVVRIAGSRIGGVVGAVVFGFGGYLASYPLPQLPVLEASIWLPLILYCLERGMAHTQRPADGTAWFAAAGLAGAALLLAGHGQTALLAGYASAGYALVRWVALRRQALPTAWQLALTGTIALGLSAPQLLATLTYLSATNRASLTYAAAAGGFAPRDYLQLLLPGGLFLRSYYIGLLPLLLCLVALRRRAAWGWAVMWLVASLVALGGNGPLYALLFAHAPGFNAFRDQERAGYLVAFASACLAGLGAASMMQWRHGVEEKLGETGKRQEETSRPADGSGSDSPVSRRRAPPWIGIAIGLTTIGLTLAGAALLRQAAPTATNPGFVAPVAVNARAALLLGLAAVLTLGAIRAGLLHRTAAALLLCLLPAINLLGADGSLSRTTSDPAPPVAPTVAAFLHSQAGVWRVDSLRDDELPRNAGALLDLSFPRGDDPIVLARAADLAGQSNRYRVWLLFNVEYVVSREDPGPGLQKVFAGDGLSVFRLQYPLPRAWAVRDVVGAASPSAAEQATLALAQPGAAVVMQQPPPIQFADRGLPSDQHEQWLDVSPEQLRLGVTLSDDAMLVLSQPLAPGWQATVDGKPARLYAADLAFMALPVAAGQHTIVLHYEPPGWRWWLAAAAIALLLVAGAFVLPRALDPRRAEGGTLCASP